MKFNIFINVPTIQGFSRQVILFVNRDDEILRISVLGENFLKYMEAFKPFFTAGLKNYEEYQVGGCIDLLDRYAEAPSEGYHRYLPAVFPEFTLFYNTIFV